MSSLPEILDLDQSPSIPVVLGGREFKLTQQSWPVIQRVFFFTNADDGEGKVEKKGSKEETLAEMMARNFERSLPVIALMFGYTEDDTTKQEVVDHLRNHLTPGKALKVFQAWWQLNEADDFFDRGGNILLHPEIVEAIRANKDQLLAPVESPS